MKTSDYIAGLNYAKKVIDDEINKMADIEMYYAIEDAMFTKALDLCAEANIPASKEHTGGGIHVIYVREPFIEAGFKLLVNEDDPKWEDYEYPHIGITPDEEDQTRFLVIGYRHSTDDSLTWIEHPTADELIPTLRVMIDDMRRHIAAEYERGGNIPHREWVASRLVEGDLFTVKDHDAQGIWNVRMVLSADIRYEEWEGGDNRPSRTVRPIIAMFWKEGDGHIAHSFEWVVYWADEIGLNDWAQWFPSYSEALIYYSRLFLAVATDSHIDEIDMEVDIRNQLVK